MSTLNQDLVNDIYDSIKLLIKERKVDLAVIIELIPEVMQFAGSQTTISDEDKQELVIMVIDKILIDTIKDDKERATIISIVPITIKVAYAAWKQRYVFKRRAQGCLAFFKTCCKK